MRLEKFKTATNVIAGLVTRDGRVWVNGIPLSHGTNLVTVTTTSFTGNSTATNFTVVGNDVGLTFTPLDEGQLNQTSANVSGTVGDASYAVTVNGVSATVTANTNGGGDWTAGVPIADGGTASFYAEVRDSLGHLLATQMFAQTKPAVCRTMSYAHHGEADTYNFIDNWTYAAGGKYMLNSIFTGISGGILPPGDAGGEAALNASYIGAQWENNAGSRPFQSVRWHTETHLMIEPSDQVRAGATALYLISAHIFGLEELGGSFVERVLSPATIRIQGRPMIDTGDSYGAVLLTAPAGMMPEITPQPEGVPNYRFNDMGVGEVKLKIMDAAGHDLTSQTNTVIKRQPMA